MEEKPATETAEKPSQGHLRQPKAACLIDIDFFSDTECISCRLFTCLRGCLALRFVLFCFVFPFFRSASAAWCQCSCGAVVEDVYNVCLFLLCTVAVAAPARADRRAHRAAGASSPAQRRRGSLPFDHDPNRQLLLSRSLRCAPLISSQLHLHRTTAAATPLSCRPQRAQQQITHRRRISVCTLLRTLPPLSFGHISPPLWW